MAEALSLFLDVVMIGLLITAIVYAVRLGRQLAALRAQRGEMERFVMDFNGIVVRAEAGVKGLKQAARAGGDDLEQLIDKARLIRDELQFLVSSADQIATRLSQTAITAARTPESTNKTEVVKTETLKTDTPKTEPVARATAEKQAETATANNLTANNLKAAPTKAELELMRALEKLG